jgi:Tfp pilus assembly protein PilZ
MTSSMELQRWNEDFCLATPATHAERRDNTRYPCEGKVKIYREGAASAFWGIVSDLSYGGCYVESPSPLPVGSRIKLSLTILDMDLEVEGKVAAVHPMVGMGIMFLSCSAQTNQSLEQMLSTLAGTMMAPEPSALLGLASDPVPGELEMMPSFKVSPGAACSVLDQIVAHLSRSSVLTRHDLLDILQEVRRCENNRRS